MRMHWLKTKDGLPKLPKETMEKLKKILDEIQELLDIKAPSSNIDIHCIPGDKKEEILKELSVKEKILKILKSEKENNNEIKVNIKIDKKKFKKFYQKMEEGTNDENEKMKFFLTMEGDLYMEPREQYCYKLKEEGKRYKIIKFLVSCHGQGYQPTESIKTEAGYKNNKMTRTEISKIRYNIKKYFQINGEDFLQSKTGSGYRINPKYEIIPKKE